MTDQEKEFLQRLRQTFRGEAADHLAAISAGLLELEKGAAPERWGEFTELVFREAHSLKGAARSVDLSEVGVVCQSLENLLAALKSRALEPSPQLFDLCYEVIDELGALVAIEGGLPPEHRSRAAELAQRLEDAVEGRWTAAAGRADGDAVSPPPRRAASPQKAEEGHRAASGEGEPAGGGERPSPALSGPTLEQPAAVVETVRLPVAKLDRLLLEAEEMISVKLSAAQRRSELIRAQQRLALWQRQWSELLPEIEQLLKRRGGEPQDRRSRAREERLSEFLSRSRAELKGLNSELAALTAAAGNDLKGVSSMVDALLADTKEMLMLPFSLLSEAFPRLVRDLAHQQGKQVELTVEGEDIEIDKRILQELKDPLIHALRNSIDHGIEEPAERERRGKAAAGRVVITLAQREGSRVEITVSDDGGGIDAERLRQAAVQQGLIGPAAAAELGPEQLLGLALRSGVSTSPIITDLSGRGLGLAIVSEKVKKLGGELALTSEPGAGTTLRLLIPLSLATFRGVLVSAAGQLFVLPAAAVDAVLKIPLNEIETVAGRETATLAGRTLPLAWLGQVLELPRQRQEAAAGGWLNLLVLGAGEGRIGFVVDGVVGEQEVLTKSLGGQLARVRNVSGATVLGSGQLVLILNAADLLKSVLKTGAAATGAEASPAPAPPLSILLAEDSITSRTLLKNILESAGYRVTTAVDGLDALGKLQAGRFDLLVSDVQMPRLDGFDLTGKLRADKRYAELPVVLVTGLESTEDRKRGIDVGADAYIVKSTFDQSNLLEVVGRLV